MIDRERQNKDPALPLLERWNGRPVKYALALAVVAFAILIRWMLIGVMGFSAPYFTLFPAVMLAAFFLGLGPGLLGGLAGSLLAELYLVSPADSPHPALAGVLRALVLCFSAVLLGFAGAALRPRRQAANDLNASGSRLRTILQHLPAGVLILDADTHQHQSIERELRQSEAFSRSVLNAMPASVVVLDRQGMIVRVNEEWKRFARQNEAPDPERAWLGDNYLDVCRRAAASGLPAADEAADCLEKLMALMKGATDQFDLEYSCHSPWEQRWFMMRAALVPEGERYVVISHVNITEGKLVEEALRKSEELLRIDIAERKRMEEALQQADRRKDEFLAMLAHELRNPLAPIRNAVAVLHMAGPADLRLQRQREIIDRQVSHMARLLDDLLDISRITRGNIILKKQPVHLSELIARAVETVTPLIEARRHTLSLTTCPAHPDLFGDLDRLIQVVGNLLANAAKYTEDGGMICLESMIEGEEVVIRVRDTGMGIAPEMLPRVFDVFTQVESSLESSQGGLGLGLTLVQSLVQMHGGRVEARSEGLGKGSEFIVRLPLHPALGA